MKKVVKTKQNDPDFYALLGPVFGSRQIEKETLDRFYDDPDKIWFVTDGGAASILNGSIRNFWARDGACAQALLAAMLRDGAITCGTVPRTYAQVFKDMGFATAPYRKNFLEVRYEKN